MLKTAAVKATIYSQTVLYTYARINSRGFKDMNSLLQFVDELKEKKTIAWEGIRELVRDADIKKISYNCAALAVGILLSRCDIMGAIYPFGQAYFVCMLMYSSYYRAAFAGCVIGWLSLFPAIPFSGVMNAVVAMGILPIVTHRYKVEKTRLLKCVYVFCCVLGVFLFNMNGRYFAVVGMFDAAVAILCMFIYDKTANALFVHKKRSRLTDDEAICVVFCLCTLVIFTGGLKIQAFEVNVIIAGILTMGFGYIFGSTVGAAAGIICGLCVSLGGGSIYTIGSMGVCGFFCGLVNRYGRIAGALCYIAANALLTLYINGSSFVILPIQSTLVSAAIIVTMPKAIMESIKDLLCNTLNKSREERYYVEKYNDLAREKIDNLSKLFKTMAQLFFDSGKVRDRPDAQASDIIRNAAAVSCRNCIRYKKCWEEGFLASYGAFEALAQGIITGKEHEGEITNCINEQKVILALKQAISHAQIVERACVDKHTGNELLSKQFQGVSHMLANLNGEIKNNVRFESEIERNIRDELTLFGVMVHDVCVMNVAGAYRCQVDINGCGGNLECKNKIRHTVSKFCGKPMTLEKSLCASGKNKRCKLEFETARPLKVNTFVAQASKEDVCGDSYKIGYVSDGQYMMCLSDGMGSGTAAKEESSACVELLHSFFKAGFEESVVFATVNKLLMLKSDSEIFTTVDLCMVDVVRCRACFTKIGAVPSVILKRGRGACVIRGDSLPLGILDEVNEKSFAMDIEDGDILIMFTDGVYDSICGVDGEIDKAVMDAANGCTDIKEITSAIIDKCKEANNGENKDDMTILISMFKTERSC